jgi:predicted nucleic acid-binding protein
VKVGLDTNVLVCAHLATTDEHLRVRSRLLQLLDDDAVTVVVTPLVLHELIHIITDGRRFETPVPMAEAVALARLYLQRPNVEVASVTEGAFDRALYLLERHNLGRKHVADALLASALLEHGVTQLMTCDGASWGIDEMEVIDPRS